jgi:predicted ABC-type ATPase
MDFAFETTCSGMAYVRRLKAWKQAGYRIEIVYLRLRSPELALRRIAARVRQGGHDVPRAGPAEIRERMGELPGRLPPVSGQLDRVR